MTILFWTYIGVNVIMTIIALTIIDNKVERTVLSGDKTGYTDRQFLIAGPISKFLGAFSVAFFMLTVAVLRIKIHPRKLINPVRILTGLLSFALYIPMFIINGIRMGILLHRYKRARAAWLKAEEAYREHYDH